MVYGNALTLDTPFSDAVAAVREALLAQGFGIVSEVDIAATLRAGIGVEMVDPQMLVEVTGNAELAGIAAEVAAALDEAMRSLSPA